MKDAEYRILILRTQNKFNCDLLVGLINHQNSVDTRVPKSGIQYLDTLKKFPDTKFFSRNQLILRKKEKQINSKNKFMGLIIM